MIVSLVIKFEFKKDGMLILVQMVNGKIENEIGKWMVKGNLIMILNFMGKNGGLKSFIGMISKDGKMFFFDFLDEMKK